MRATSRFDSGIVGRGVLGRLGPVFGDVLHRRVTDIIRRRLVPMVLLVLRVLVSGPVLDHPQSFLVTCRPHPLPVRRVVA
ncbi:hypothetical protein [Rhodopseudomonas sp.]|uniref:hypothetical protein n=1 Tax=Rhodopseudomonas sp. TaxID=1078 RepID=UPI003B3A635E